MKKLYQIFVDSTADLSQEMADELNLSVIPLVYVLDGKEYTNYLDHREMPPEEFYRALKSGKTASTTQVSAFRYKEAWEPVLKNGQDILYICLSSGLSKSYDQSKIAVNELAKKYPNNKVVSLDSKAASLGIGLLAIEAAKCRDKDITLDETLKIMEDLIPNLHHWIIVDDLGHLRRGGRVSGAAAFVGSMLNVKPILTLLGDGSITPVAKARGRRKAVEFVLKKMEEHCFNPINQTIAMAHSASLFYAMELKEAITKKYPDVEFLFNGLGPVIGAHTGSDTIACAFIAGPRHTTS